MNQDLSLKIKIEDARGQLPKEAKQAIDAVDWKSVVLGMKEKKGYSLEQLEELENATDFLLCGLLSPENYPKELENKMKIPQDKANELVNEMNELVFKRIREEMIKISEKNKVKETVIPLDKEEIEGFESENKVLETAGIKIIKENEPVKPQFSVASKLATSFQIPTAKTNYTATTGGGISKINTSPSLPVSNAGTGIPQVDPYREMPV